MKVLVVSPWIAERLNQKDLLPEDIQIVVPTKGTDEELMGLAGDVEVIVSTRLSNAVVKAARKMKLLQKTGAGVDAMPFEALGEDVYMANTSGANPAPMAEGAVTLVLALAKRVVQRHSLFPERDMNEGVELRGKSAGIIGLGHIGVEVAKRLQAFEMNILAIKRRPSEELKNLLNIEFLGGPGDLSILLRKSDFVVLTVPLTPATRGMIGEYELRQMKPTAFLINVARAAIIQEEPLYKALKERWIAGAALDVWWNPHWWDPFWNPRGKEASSFPIWELPNVIATAHDIVSTDSSYGEALKIIAENIKRTRDGKPPINQVDKTHRY